MRFFAVSTLLVLLGCLARNAPGPSSPPGAPDVSSARPGATPSSVPAPSMVELRFDEVAARGECSVRLLELEDSRCPAGVQCVWEGRAAVTVEVRRGDSPAGTVELTLQAGREEAARSAAGCQLRLLGVEPYPREGVTPGRGEIVATVEVRPP